MIYINLVTVGYCGADLFFFSLSLLKAVTCPRIVILRPELFSTQMACHVSKPSSHFYCKGLRFSFSLESLSGNSINHHAAPTVVNVVRRQTYLQMAGLRKWS